MAITSNFTHEDMAGVTLICRNIKTGFTVPGQSYTAQTPSTNSAITAGSTNVMTQAANWGTVLNLNATGGGTVTLPAATGTGNVYEMAVTTSLTSSSTWVISCAGSDTMGGFVAIAATTSGSFAATAGTSVSVTLTATTKGGLKGGTLFFTDDLTGVWRVRAFLVGSGTAVTPIT